MAAFRRCLGGFTINLNRLICEVGRRQALDFGPPIRAFLADGVLISAVRPIYSSSPLSIQHQPLQNAAVLQSWHFKQYGTSVLNSPVPDQSVSDRVGEQSLPGQALTEDEVRPERVLAEELAPSMEHPGGLGPMINSRGDLPGQALEILDGVHHSAGMLRTKLASTISGKLCRGICDTTVAVGVALTCLGNELQILTPSDC